MAPRRNRIPEKDSEFDQYLKNSTDYLLEGTSPVNWERLGLTSDEMDEWEEFRDDWDILYPKYTNKQTRTTAIKDDKNDMKKDFRVFADPLLVRMSVSPAITNDDRAALNLPKRDTVPTERGPITDVPDVNVVSEAGCKVKIRCRIDEDANRASMHPLADAIEVRIQIGGTAPATPDACPIRFNSTKALFRYETGLEFDGQKIYVYCRYINEVNPANNGSFSTRRVATLHE